MSVLVRSRVDEETVETAEKILNHLGLSMQDYIRISIKQLEIKQGLPFDMVVSLPDITRGQKWKEENRESMAEYVAYIEKHGSFADKNRKW